MTNKVQTKIQFKVGDKVKVVKRVEEEKGWKNSWTSGMDDLIGKLFTIKTITRTGIQFNETPYHFPPSSLELVERIGERNGKLLLELGYPVSIFLDGVRFETPTKYYPYIESKEWYEEIPEQGILCWVWDRANIHYKSLKLIKRKSLNTGRYVTDANVLYDNAVPVTEKEIMHFIYKPEGT